MFIEGEGESIEEIEDRESDEYKTRLFLFDFLVFVCSITTESSLQEDILEFEVKSCKWKILSYSKLDGMEIAVDAELWLCFIRCKLAITGEDRVFSSFSEQKLDEDDEEWVGK